MKRKKLINYFALTIVGVGILSLMYLIPTIIIETKKEKVELESKIKMFNEVVLTDKVNRTNVDIVSYELSDLGVDSKTSPRSVFKNSLKVMNKENFNWSDLSNYDVYYLNDRNIKENHYIDAVEVYSDKVKRPILSVYEFEGEYWNPIILVPKK